MLSIEVMQKRVATPSTCTVQAPQSAMPQPNFVPVMPSTSRNTQSSGVSPSTSTVRSMPLTLIVASVSNAHSEVRWMIRQRPRESFRRAVRVG
jgi:hypothetical protein